MQQRLGTGFRLKVPNIFRSNADYCRRVTGADGKETLMYAGPALDDTLIEEIRKVEGVAQYDAELDEYVLLENGELIPGMFTAAYEEYRQAGEMEMADNRAFWSREAMAYGHTDTSLADAFRTGSFSLIEGRHITPQDEWKVLISDRLAQQNGFRLGDSLTLSNRNGMGGWAGFYGLIGELQQVEIVGISMSTASSRSRSGWLRSTAPTIICSPTLRRCSILTMLHMRNSTVFPGRASYMKT